MILLTLFLVGELCHTSGFIDIPTAPQYDKSGMLGVGLAFSMPFSQEDPDPTDLTEPDPMDFTATLKYGFAGRGEVALSMYTPSTFALSIGYLLVREGSAPAIFMGIDDISYKPYLSTISNEEEGGFIEERNYAVVNGGRAPELLSAYIGMQKSFSVFNVVLGFGRGRFVGYAPRSIIFNTDQFVLGDDYKTEDHSSWAFAVFFGGSIRLPMGLEFIAEIDGRDGNAGIKYHHKYFNIALAVAKAEHFWSPAPYSPRFTAGLEVNNRFMTEGPRIGSIECVVRDVTSKEHMANYFVDIKEVNKRYRAKGSTFGLSLPVGNYTITVSMVNYEDYIAKISVKPGVKSKLIFNLKKTQEALMREAVWAEKQNKIRTFFEQGKIYYTEGKINDAATAFQNCLALDPDHSEAKNFLTMIEPRRQELIRVYSAEARSRTAAKSYTQAIASWQKVLELDPNNSAAKTGIANIRNQIAAAKKPTTPTKPTTPSKPTLSNAQVEALYNKGVSYFTSENYEAALRTFNQVLAARPNHSGAKDYKKRTQARLKILKGGG